jgi:hypothetical protein
VQTSPFLRTWKEESMKAISKQGWQLSGNHQVATPLRLKFKSAMNSSNNGHFRFESRFLEGASLHHLKHNSITQNSILKRNALPGSHPGKLARAFMLNITGKMEAELHELRYCLEDKVRQRTLQLMKRIELLESCNVSLGKRLASTCAELTALKHASVAIDPQAATDQLKGIGDWACNMIGLQMAGV